MCSPHCFQAQQFYIISSIHWQWYIMSQCSWRIYNKQEKVIAQNVNRYLKTSWSFNAKQWMTMAKQARWQVTWSAFRERDLKQACTTNTTLRARIKRQYNLNISSKQDNLRGRGGKETIWLTWRPTSPRGSPACRKPSGVLYQLIQWSRQRNNDGVVPVVLLRSGFGQRKLSQVPRSIEKHAPILGTSGLHAISTVLYACWSVYFRLKRCCTSLQQESAADKSNSMPSDYLGNFLFMFNIIYKY